MPVGSAIEDSSYVLLSHYNVILLVVRELLANAKIQAVAYLDFFAVRAHGDGFASFHGVARWQDKHTLLFDVALNDNAVF
jgi:hypothetical protein